MPAIHRHISGDIQPGNHFDVWRGGGQHKLRVRPSLQKHLLRIAFRAVTVSG